MIVYGFETSNNYKVRVALGAKDLAYEFRTIDPGDRSTIVEASGHSLAKR
ncbi:MAG TPA: glutathione S-transferase N-terminal domain-containing protein [Acidobacteriota bacterium]|nr:glutathione S-transferase N-terminal domain-containing protein [Acidobacteriota bacterium]